MRRSQTSDSTAAHGVYPQGALAIIVDRNPSFSISQRISHLKVLNSRTCTVHFQSQSATFTKDYNRFYYLTLLVHVGTVVHLSIIEKSQ